MSLAQSLLFWVVSFSIPKNWSGTAIFQCFDISTLGYMVPWKMPKAVGKLQRIEKAVCNLGLIQKLSCEPRQEEEMAVLCGVGTWGRQPVAENKRPVGLKLRGREVQPRGREQNRGPLRPFETVCASI